MKRLRCALRVPAKTVHLCILTQMMPALHAISLMTDATALSLDSAALEYFCFAPKKSC